MLAVAPSDERTVALERRRLRCDRPVPGCATMPRWVTNPVTTSPCESLRLPTNCRDVTAEKVGTVIGRGDGCEGNEARMTEAA